MAKVILAKRVKQNDVSALIIPKDEHSNGRLNPFGHFAFWLLNEHYFRRTL